MALASATTLHPARLSRVWDETPTLRGLAFEPFYEFSRAHASPGQYVKVSPEPGVEGIFALASPPGHWECELLVKRGSIVADALANLEADSAIGVSLPAGKGFPIAQHTGHDILLFAAGSGIAPIHAVIAWIVPRRPEFGRVRLYYGHRRGEDFAYLAQHDAWRHGGIDLHLVASAADDGWQGARGYVQDVLRSQPPADLAHGVAYLCGMKGMTEAVTKVLVDLGLSKDRVFLNF